MSKKALKTRINHGILLLIVLLAVTLIVFNGRLFYNMMNEQAEVIGREQLEVVSGRLKDTLNEAKLLLMQVAETMELLQRTEATDEEYMEALLAYREKFRYQNCMNAYIGRTGWFVVPDFFNTEGFEINERMWYQGARKNGVGNIYVTPPYQDVVTGGMCFTVSVLLKDKESVTALDFNLSSVQNSIQEAGKNVGGDNLIISADGQIVAYADEEVIGKRISDALPQYTIIFRRILSSGEKSKSFVTEIGGQKSTVFYSKSGNAWYLISLVSNSDLYRANYVQLLRNLLLNLFLVLGLALMYILNYRRRIETEKTLLAEEKLLEERTLEIEKKVQEILKDSSEGNKGGRRTSEVFKQIRDSASEIGDSISQIRLSARVIDTMQQDDTLSETEDAGISANRNRLALMAILLILVLSMALSIFISTRAMRMDGNNRMEDETGNYLYEVELWIAEQKGILEMFVSSISAHPELMDDYERAVEWLDGITKQFGDISVTYMANPEAGHTVIMNNGWEPEEGWKVEERQWYIDTIASEAENGFSVSAPYYDEQTGLYCVTMSERVYDANGDFIGIFGIDFYLDKLIGILNASYTDQGYAILVDKDGTIINHPYKGYELQVDSSSTIEEAGYLGAIYSDKPVVIKDYDGKRKVAMASIEETSNFSVICIKNWGEIYGNMIRYDLLFALLFGVCILSVLYVIRMLMRWQEKANRILQDAAIKATRAGEAKTQFLAQMSHEIRTPINAVLGMDEMILRESGEEEIKGYAKDIQSAGSSLLSIINDILDLSKIESGKLTIVPVRYELAEVLHDLVNMIEFRAREKNLALVVQIDPKLPSGLFGDDVRIRQVITNILTNSVKYTHTGTIWFRVSGKREGNTEELYVEVEDTGIGIRKEDQEKLFSAFDRIDEVKNRNIEGTGLGMNITQRLLALMGSRIQVDSTYGEGSRFFFYLKQEIVDDTPIGDFKERIRQATEDYTYEEAFYAPNARLLAVDDNVLNLKVFSSLLKRTGVKITGASSGEECLKLTAQNPYDLIFLDHMMPEMDGIETLHHMKENSGGPNASTPVFALTANAVTGAREMYLSEGFDGFLTKPIVADKLEAVIKEALSPTLFEKAPGKEEGKPGESAELPVIGGVDWSYARSHLGDDELIRSTLNDFLDLLEINERKLSAAYDIIENEGNFEGYRIQVHSMKSVTATLGIIPLAGMANVLEYAARDGKLEEITRLHPVFIECWQSYGKELSKAFGREDEVQLSDLEPAEIKEKLLRLKDSMAELDLDVADPLMQELLTCRVAPELSEKFTELKGAVTALDSDGAEQIVDYIIERL
ncbi:MAG: response regulator [Lachnospiraceae bacterium]|nr:response regulator [Lachnospiraceae bacterium]